MNEASSQNLGSQNDLGIAASLSNPVPLFIFEVIYVMLHQLESSATRVDTHTLGLDADSGTMQEALFQGVLIHNCAMTVRHLNDSQTHEITTYVMSTIESSESTLLTKNLLKLMAMMTQPLTHPAVDLGADTAAAAAATPSLVQAGRTTPSPQIFHPLLELVAHVDLDIRHCANTILVSSIKSCLHSMGDRTQLAAVEAFLLESVQTTPFKPSPTFPLPSPTVDANRGNASGLRVGLPAGGR